MRDGGCTVITNRDITVDDRKGVLVACESGGLLVFEYQLSGTAVVM